MNMAWCRTTGTLACGIAAVLALAGCASGGSGHPAGSSTAKAVAGTKTSAAPSPSSSLPAWASALGPDVTVTAPGSPAPGNDSPGAAVSGLIKSFEDKQYTKSCAYEVPANQQDCKTGSADISSGDAADAPSVKNAAVGYVAIDGTRAVAGITGTFCTAGNSGCFTNNDPARVFTTAHSFAALWKSSSGASASDYSLTPCEKINGEWYISSLQTATM